MNDSADVLRMHQLLDSAQAGEIDAADRDRLERLLLSSDAALAAFVERCYLETALRFEVRSAAATRRIDAALSGMRPPAGKAPYVEPASRVEGALRRRSFRAWGAALIAASLLISAAAWLAERGAPIVAVREPAPVARLVGVDGAAWLGDKFTVGHRFREGDSVYLTAGSARISMASGAEVALRAPCFVSLEDEMLVRLEEGELTAQVAEWAHGFTVDTGTLRVVDLGTKFAVSTDRRGAAEAHVLDGQVRVHPSVKRAQASSSFLLSRGEALRFQERTKVTTKLQADLTRFDTDLSDVAPFKPIPMANTGRGLEPGDTDRHWRVVAGPKCNLYDGPTFATVCEADRRYLSNEPAHSQWVSLVNPVRPGAPENQLFTFENRFDLSGYDPESVVISAQVLADNGVRTVRINGQTVPLESWTLNEPEQVFNRFHVVEITEGFVPGENVVQFDVWNGVDRVDEEPTNPLALRVEWRAFGRPVQREAAVETHGAHDAHGVAAHKGVHAD